MAERALRGARLGAQSFEDERGVEMAPRQEVEYRLPDGRTFTVTMSDEAEIPAEWEDPKTGQIGRRVGAEAPAQDADEKPVRTHWDMLLERRSVEELEDLLSERLELLRGGEIGPPHLHRRKKKSA
ncbi:RNA polymerase-binding protein RbpA [uncultured Aeromicrobium sp.]|uniref:RNA polymerase-binding protein RbpA n=1 Tax=uncultured Aeromicrobium sp. TaxID=337820 RepID=UPI0025E108DA|nr:RNA polymerase-binding protein RbpA [uncultured Aeromicrobium sp.]